MTKRFVLALTLTLLSGLVAGVVWRSAPTQAQDQPPDSAAPNVRHAT